MLTASAEWCYLFQLLFLSESSLLSFSDVGVIDQTSIIYFLWLMSLVHQITVEDIVGLSHSILTSLVGVVALR